MATEWNSMAEGVRNLQIPTGTTEEFSELVRTHAASVRWYLIRILRDQVIADDLAQEVFLHVYQRMDEYRGEGSVRAWLLGIARNLALQHIRSNIRRRAREESPLQVQLARWRMERMARDPWDQMDQEEAMAALNSCLEGFPDQSKNIVKKHYFEHQTIETIAQTLGRNGGAVRMMLFRIRQALADCIQNKMKTKGLPT